MHSVGPTHSDQPIASLPISPRGPACYSGEHLFLSHGAAYSSRPAENCHADGWLPRPVKRTMPAVTLQRDGWAEEEIVLLSVKSQVDRDQILSPIFKLSS